MRVELELRNQVQSLTQAEKRYVSLIGKARSGATSQVLDLFNWINRSGQDEDLPLVWRNTFPTLSMRLRELMFDCLRLLNKDSGIDFGLRAKLDEIMLLQSKKHYQAARRVLRKAQKQALHTSRYACLLQCIEAELLLIQLLPPNKVIDALNKLRREEKRILEKHQQLRELRYRHDSILALLQQYPFSRDVEIINQVLSLANVPLVTESLQAEAYLEPALAVNILGMRDVFLRQPEQCIHRYRDLLAQWKVNKHWQADQPDLLMLMCRYYQNACLYATVNPDELHAELLSLHEIDGLPPDRLRAFRETLFHHRFILHLNAGQPEEAIRMIGEIERWMKQEAGHLTEVQLLPFLCNFAVAEFMAEQFSEAAKTINRILRIHTRKARLDIRDFAIVLQPVIQYEMNNTEFNEYLTRSGRRHFSKKERENKFELIVFRHIEQLAEITKPAAVKKSFEQFVKDLLAFNKTHDTTVPLLGFNEVYMWAQARIRGVSVKTIFLEELEKARAARE